ncbi:MAG: hypothetical protein GX638_07305 [Crenarchaeota archaeon]|nr:hypothetical protein [Thermoproteota archaeon]
MTNSEIGTELNQKMYDLLYGKLTIKDFENWVYNTESLEQYLPPNDYLDLITLDYNKCTKIDIETIINRHIDCGTIKKNRLLTLLNKALERPNELPSILRTFYDLYSHGYTFLKDLGLGYGLSCEVPIADNYSAQTWENLTENEQKEMLDSFYPEIERDLNRTIKWITDGKIIITGKQHKSGDWEFIDKRSIEEKKSNVWVEVYKNPENGSSIEKNTIWEKRKRNE